MLSDFINSSLALVSLNIIYFKKSDLTCVYLNIKKKHLLKTIPNFILISHILSVRKVLTNFESISTDSQSIAGTLTPHQT